MEKWENLIEILLDESASDAERDDAAMELSEYNHGHVMKTLMITAKDDKVDSCGKIGKYKLNLGIIHAGYKVTELTSNKKNE